MTYEFGATNEQWVRLRELAELLSGCREVFIAMFDDGMLTPNAGSQAAHDFALELRGPAGAWPADINIQPRALAAKLVRQQADYCVALGAQIAAGEVFDPMSSLVRSIFEYGIRTTWVIDPSANDPSNAKTGHRVRSARTLLMELVSIHHFREALSDRGDIIVRKDQLKRHWRKLRRLADDMFDNVLLADDPSKWQLCGEVYPSWTTLAKAWATLEGSPVPVNRLYQLLAVEDHPQGFAATRGLRAGPIGPERAVDMEDVINRVQLAVASYYSALTLLAKLSRIYVQHHHRMGRSHRSDACVGVQVKQRLK